MKKGALVTLTLTALLFALPGFAGMAQEKAKDQMLTDLDIIKNTFAIKYAPAEWKKIYADWDLNEEIDLAKVKVLEKEDITVKDYQRILVEFFNSMKDYHVGVTFFSTELSVLPLRIHSANGKYYTAWVMDQLFGNVKDPLKKGDEVLFFNGKPIDEAVQELKASDFGNPLSLTDQALAESALTMRSGESGNIVPKGPVDITVRKAKTNKLVTYQLNWFHMPEEITSSISPLMAAAKSRLLQTDGLRYFVTHSFYKKPLGQSPFFFKDMATPLYATYQRAASSRRLIFKKVLEEAAVLAQETDDDPFIGAKQSFVPILGELVWEAPETHPYRAYIYLNEEGRKIGYVRIPHYMAGNQSALAFAELMNDFEEQTEMLVVDQVNNPGGNMFYMYALASMLTDRPLEVPQQRMTITQEDVFFALDNRLELEGITNESQAEQAIGTNLGGYPVDYDLAKQFLKYFNFIISEWNEGRQLTNPDYIYGIDDLKPHRLGYYSKPILVLVNELDFSCGDFLPAILQDNNRAKILGMRTAGAGGYVLQHSYPNLFGLKGFSYTGSIANRLDLNPLENLGVIPDFIVERTEKDLQEDHVDYKSQVNKIVKEMIE